MSTDIIDYINNINTRTIERDIRNDAATVRNINDRELRELYTDLEILINNFRNRIQIILTNISAINENVFISREFYTNILNRIQIQIDNNQNQLQLYQEISNRLNELKNNLENKLDNIYDFSNSLSLNLMYDNDLIVSLKIKYVDYIISFLTAFIELYQLYNIFINDKLNEYLNIEYESELYESDEEL